MQRDRKQFTDEEINAFIQEEKSMQHHDEEADQIVSLLDELTTLAFSFDSERQDDVLKWIEENSVADKNMLERKLNELRATTNFRDNAF